jgi:hypothetical protein
MIIPSGWFEGKNAELETNEAGQWVLIEGENGFCIKDRRVTNFSEEDQARNIEDEILRIYDMLREKE